MAPDVSGPSRRTRRLTKRPRTATGKNRPVSTHDALLGAIADAAECRRIGQIPVAAFIRDYFRDVATEDLQGADPRRLASTALGHLEFSMARRPGRPLVRVFNGDPAGDPAAAFTTIIEIVTDDMPFLVDSLSMAIDRAGTGIELTVHPIFAVERDGTGTLRRLQRGRSRSPDLRAESFARFVVPRIGGADENRELARRIRDTLGDVRAAVRDWRRMLARIREISEDMRARQSLTRNATAVEEIALLDWLAADNFTFLGYRYYRLQPVSEPAKLVPDPRSSLGILRRPRSRARTRKLTPAMRRFANGRSLLIITKASSRSTVHRPGYLDYIAVKAVDRKGRAVGEHRFLGLFTSTAYSESPRQIPVLRDKVRRLFERSGVQPQSHRGKALMHIIEHFPRDELFQGSVNELLRVTKGVLGLQDRRKVRLFVRRDVFRRFISCLAYVPRDRYNTQVREGIERVLLEAFGGEQIDTVATVSESALARLYLVVRIPPDSGKRLDIAKAESAIAETIVTWKDRLRQALVEHFGMQRGRTLFERYGDIFPLAYQEACVADEATGDIEAIDQLAGRDDSLQLRLCKSTDRASRRLRFKLIREAGLLPLSRVLPILENFGLTVISERPYQLNDDDHSRRSIQEVEILPPDITAADFQSVASRFKTAFRHTLEGRAGDDRLNRLIWLTSLEWREIVILRALCRYLVQTRVPFSASYMASVLCKHPHIAELLAHLFIARLSPSTKKRPRAEQTAALGDRLTEALEVIESLDDDRMLRGFEAVLLATTRTNYFRVMAREPAPDYPFNYLSLKLDAARIPDLPRPRPRFEIFVYAPHVEGAHLRAGFVARGGLRWSDRQEDFRTEVLGLMKAQIVKNAVIIPTGAKGGFVIKPAKGRDPWPVEDCYRTFVRGLLDVTDNIIGDRVVPPPDVARLDRDDAYLVVAADKGTATFSDTANAVAREYGFWLDDAFASGGSAGYDHKKMGITARGAWEAVKRHFRRLGTDTQTTTFTVAGIGDMSGDVFGNGMLLSPHIRLRAAFDHRHVFLDPDPDSGVGFAERKRLFGLSRSSWADYDRSLISPGGGVFDRQAKRIDLGPEVQRILGTNRKSARPPELIRMILCMEVDLLWNGGIGTYVKASSESDSDVGDRANDAVRVNAQDLRCKVVGEGGNLGFTQRARIEYARSGGLINTDAIDNSAGVDCSDREVNIKILLSIVRRDTRMTEKRRDQLLVRMTDEVAKLVLRDNYLQTQAIATTAAYASERLMEHAELIRVLEEAGRIDRDLPDDAAINERAKLGEGLSGPELATIISHAKILLAEQLIDTDIPEDLRFAGELATYFPQPLRKYDDALTRHPLRREIISTLLANDIVDRAGPTFVMRAQRETGQDTATIARAFTVIRTVFDLDSLWQNLEALDNHVPASAQYAMLFQTGRMLRQAAYWLLQHQRDETDIDRRAAELKPAVGSLLGRLDTLLKGAPRRRLRGTVAEYEQLGVRPALAERVAALTAAVDILDVIDLAAECGRDIDFVARTYLEIGRGLNLAWLRAEVENLAVRGRWHAAARRQLRVELQQAHRDITARQLRDRTAGSPDGLVMKWLADCGVEIKRTKSMLLDIKSRESIDFATLSVAVRELRQLAG